MRTAASPFARLPADEIGRLPESGETAACARLLHRLAACAGASAGELGGGACLLLGDDPAWEQLAAGLPGLGRCALGPEFQWRTTTGARAASAEFFAALQRSSPRWLSSVPAPPSLGSPSQAPPHLAAGGSSPGPPSFLVHQGRSHLGDMLWLTPLLRAIHQRFPGASVTVVGGAAAAHALADNPHCTELLPFAPPPDGHVSPAAAHAGLRDQLRRRRFDAALFAFARRPQCRWLAEEAAALRIPWRIDLEYFESADDGRTLDPLFTHQGWFFWGTMASPRLLLAALDPLTTPAPAAAGARLEYFAAERWRRAAADRLTAHGCADQPFAVLAPGARSSDRWPPRKFAALAWRLAAELGFHVLIEGGPADAAVLDAVAEHLRRLPALPNHPILPAPSNPPDLPHPPLPAPSNHRDLPDLPNPADPADQAAATSGPPLPPRIGVYQDPFGVLAALLERASLLVSNDSAPIHLAETSGTPTLYFAHHEKLTHSHPAGPGCWALYDGARNRLARITVGQALGAIAEMVRAGEVLPGAARRGPIR